MKYWNYNQDKITLFLQFKKHVLEKIKGYKLPMIRLMENNTKEAVCLIFEKVNTGGEKLDAFELLTAMFAATGTVNLRTDWHGEEGNPGLMTQLHKSRVLLGIGRTDFLRAVSLAHTYEKRRDAEAEGKTDKDLPSVSCTHAALLDIPADAYVKWRDPITRGFEEVARFLGSRGLYQSWDVPYPPQIIALAALFALHKNAPVSAAEAKKIERWFWCGVFGELYGSSTDSRLASDVEDLCRWFECSETDPGRSVLRASVSPGWIPLRRATRLHIRACISCL